ncbi:MAG: XrtA/PEP-CTERM system histidine kinase PrsK [Gammaproteobacteria bacterium]
MFNFTVFLFLVATLAFLVLTLLMIAVRTGSERGALLLIFACAVSTAWCAAMAHRAGVEDFPPYLLEALVTLRCGAWIAFLHFVLRLRLGDHRKKGARAAAASTILAGFGGLIVAAMAVPYIDATAVVGAPPGGHLFTLFAMLLAMVGLILVERIYRATPLAHRRAMQFLCLGVGGMFAYDLAAYSFALFFQRTHWGLGSGHGILNAIIVPLIAVAAARNPQWGVSVFVSRHVAFYTISLVGAGTGALMVGSLGYYLFLRTGVSPTAAFVGSLFSALVILALMLFGRFRSRLKVFLSKHFYRSKYDYRKAWLHFTHTLSTGPQGLELEKNIIRAIAELVDSPGGVMWMRQDTGCFQPVGQWQISLSEASSEPADSSLIRFLEASQWVVYLDEYEKMPQRYRGLELPVWLQGFRPAWLIAPLWQRNELMGYIVLLRGDSEREFNFEDSDLLKTVGRQAASYLALIRATEALAQARQFEAFNRLASFVVHDLKNLVAQLSLVVSNAQIHRHNPAFMQDAIETVAGATAKMNRLLSQLRKGRLEKPGSERVMFGSVAHKVAEMRRAYHPIPQFDYDERELLWVEANPDRLAAVVEHLIQNAQEATPPEGRVSVRLYRETNFAVLEVEDSGNGMTPQFVSERLFRPFDTTKGNAGMGVGMYESREFVRTFGGNIAVDSTPGKGTLIRVRLPLASPSLEARSAPSKAAQTPAETGTMDMM